MRKLVGLTLLVLVSLSVVLAAQNPAATRSAYMDVNYGFALFAPKFPKATNQNVTPVIFTGPGEAGFSSNVNVTILPLPANTTRKAYHDQSLNEFRQAGLKVNSERNVTVSGKDAIRFDYEGQARGKNLHFLSLAVIDRDRVIVVTCAATAEAFPAIEPEFSACLDSFKLK
jgi:hypothetical protein